MKTLRILVALTFSILAFSVGAEENDDMPTNAVGIYLTDGTNYRIGLDARPSVIIDDNELTIRANHADFAILDYVRMHKLTFETTETTGVATLPAIGSIRVENRRLIFSCFAVGTPYAVADIRGDVLSSGLLGVEETTLPLSPGIYLISAGGNALKVLVK